MEKDGKYFMAGLFVTVTVLAGVVFTMWLAGVHRVGKYARFTIYFTDPVSGLDPQGIVKYKGVGVGKVLAMRLADERSDLVKVDIEVKAGTPVRGQTKARIQMQGITGLNYIELTTESSDQSPPERKAGEDYPVLHGRGNQVGVFLEGLPEMRKRFLETLTSLDELSKGSVRTVESVKALADKLKEDPSQVIYPSAQSKGVAIPK
jgi:phospholipid/cholesterol/gamma-HCH transport system substrate-binding protein